MSLLAFMTALLSLLLAPGPTNTLMAVAGADGGLRQVWRLIPAEVAGYLLVVVPLAFLGAEVAARWPLVSVVVTVAASVWVLLLAVRLWSASSRSAGEQPVSARRILVTTLLNPKALVFGLVLLPPPSSPELFLSRLAMFCGLVTATALVWGGWVGSCDPWALPARADCGWCSARPPCGWRSSRSCWRPVWCASDRPPLIRLPATCVSRACPNW